VAPHVAAPVPVESATQGAGAPSVIAVATAGYATLAAAGKCARGKRRTYENKGNCKNNHSLPQHDDLSEDAPCLRHDFKRRYRSAARMGASSRLPESMNAPCDRFPDIAVVGARLLRFGRTSRVRFFNSIATSSPRAHASTRALLMCGARQAKFSRRELIDSAIGQSDRCPARVIRDRCIQRPFRPMSAVTPNSDQIADLPRATLRAITASRSEQPECH
jgi:hypothetical protein